MIRLIFLTRLVSYEQRKPGSEQGARVSVSTAETLKMFPLPCRSIILVWVDRITPPQNSLSGQEIQQSSSGARPRKSKTDHLMLLKSRMADGRAIRLIGIVQVNSEAAYLVADLFLHIQRQVV
jgi:hypothetical protein